MIQDWDKRLVRTAKAIIAAEEGGRSGEAVLKQMCPRVYRQLALVPEQSPLLALWGRSSNVDEHARQPIVHPAVLRTIERITGVGMSGEAVHAGLQHTYGYLFSLIETPYGFKRQRWIETGLERSLGFGSTIFGPAPRDGTLLANLTYFLGRIAFRGQRRELARLRRCKASAAESVQEFVYRKLLRRRITETISLGRDKSKARPLSIYTDLVSLPHQHASGPRDLLVYSIADTAKAQLITAFTVSEEIVEQLLAQPQGARVEIRTRYNLYVDGATGRALRGRRQVED